MRTPNTVCVVCSKPLYRRPYEFSGTVEFCCRSCRSQLYKKRLPSKNLELGREKGTNHLTGKSKSELQKLRCSLSNKNFAANNPDKIKARGFKNSMENHYNWKDGISSLNVAIRTSSNNKKWISLIKERDGELCVICKSGNEIEIHHIVELVPLIKKHKITSLREAKDCKELWDIENGMVVCKDCHYKIHNKKIRNDNKQRTVLPNA